MTPRNLKMTEKGVRELAIGSTQAHQTPFERRQDEQQQPQTGNFNCYRVKYAYSRISRDSTQPE